jgi:hypothetical protein
MVLIPLLAFCQSKTHSFKANKSENAQRKSSVSADNMGHSPTSFEGEPVCVLNTASFSNTACAPAQSLNQRVASVTFDDLDKSAIIAAFDICGSVTMDVFGESRYPELETDWSVHLEWTFLVLLSVKYSVSSAGASICTLVSILRVPTMGHMYYKYNDIQQ